MQNEIIDLLKSGTVQITFTKTTGEKRTCKATLDPARLPVQEKSQKTRAKNPDILTFFSVDDNGWRSCKIESIISYQSV